MNDHDARHARLMEDALAGDDAGGWAELLEQCEDCRLEWAGVSAQRAGLAAAAQGLASDRRAAVESPARDVDKDAELVSATLHRLAREPGPERAPPRRAAPSLAGRWITALAAAGLLVWLLAPFFSAGQRDSVVLGSGLSGLEVIGGPAQVSSFRWEGMRAPATWYEVELFELQADGTRRPLLRSARLETEAWLLSEGERATVRGATGPRLEWEVRAVGPGGVLDSAVARFDAPR